eukprot:SAG22_NODE_722_length_7641_cov_13.307876_2_plen_48_part_00
MSVIRLLWSFNSVNEVSAESRAMSVIWLLSRQYSQRGNIPTHIITSY